MRSPAELSFRLRQEVANVILSISAARTDLTAQTPLPVLPPPSTIAQAVRDSSYAAHLLSSAEHLLTRPFPVLGVEVDFSRPIAWRRDPLAGIETHAIYFRRIPYLDAKKVGDHKHIWEINRHQHLVLLAQAFTIEPRAEYLDAVVRHLQDWWKQNPFQRGINWASALEVGIRALSWTWIWHLLGEKFTPAFRRRFLGELYRHGLHLEYNLSIYFSPNTHLLGEAVALHAIGRLFPNFPRAAAWRHLAHEIVEQHMATKVNPDGSYFEQSTYYHLYAVDMFLFHAALEGPTSDYRDGLVRMSEFIAGISNPDGSIPLVGDDDGGRLFFPFGEPRRQARATMAAAACLLGRAFAPTTPDDFREIAFWWLSPQHCSVILSGGSVTAQSTHSAVVVSAEPPSFASRNSEDPFTPDEPSSRAFRDCGAVVFRRDDIVLVFDAGPFALGSGGHSHSDTLSIVLSVGSREVLIDPGTYNYMDREWRSAFRGSAAHNTVRIDGFDQAVEAGPFRWTTKPEVSLLDFSTAPDRDRAAGLCRYRGFTHKRTVELRPDLELVILDALDGPPGEHLVEQIWHLAEAPQQSSSGAWQLPGLAGFTLPGAVLEQGWRSIAFGTKQPAPVLVVRKQTTLPYTLQARVHVIR